MDSQNDPSYTDTAESGEDFFPKTTKTDTRHRKESRRHARRELIVLAEEIAVAATEIAAKHRAGSARNDYLECVFAYTQLADEAVSGFSSETFSKVTVSEPYRRKAVAATRSVSKLQITLQGEETETAANKRAALPMFWNMRARGLQLALQSWRNCFGALHTDAAPEISAVTEANEMLKSAYGIAAMPSWALLFWRIITGAAAWVCGLLAALYIAAAAGALSGGMNPQTMRITLIAAGAAILGILLISELYIYKYTALNRIGAARWRRNTAMGRIAATKYDTWIAVLFTLLLLLLAGAGVAGWFSLNNTAAFAGLQNAWRTNSDVGAHIHTLAEALQGFLLPYTAAIYGVFLIPAAILLFPSLAAALHVYAGQMIAATGRIREYRIFYARVNLRNSFLLWLYGIVIVAVCALTAAFTQTFFPILAYIDGIKFSYVFPIAAAIGAGIYIALIWYPFARGVSRWRATQLRFFANQRRDLNMRMDTFDGAASDSEVTQARMAVTLAEYAQLQENDLSRIKIMPFAWFTELLVFIVILLLSFLTDQFLQTVWRFFR